MKIIKKKTIAGFEFILILLSIFSFSYLIYQTDGEIEKIEENYQDLQGSSLCQNKNLQQNVKTPLSVAIINTIYEKITTPVIPLASAESFETGCCGLNINGEKCGVATKETCEPGSMFAEGALCSATSFCQKGCCYNSETGIFDKNVLKDDCDSEWSSDANCNMPSASRGCCVLGSRTTFETQGQCETDTKVLALGDNEIVDWRPELNEAQCIILSEIQKEGACVFKDKTCKFLNEGDCLGLEGEFSEGYLCTSPSLNTACKKTKETTCVEGKDGVYFKDTCGNLANIYDSSKAEDDSYWDKLITRDKACGAEDKDGNADSDSCGNCNRFLGGVCRSALEDGFNTDWGNYYCKSTSCKFKGEDYKNGESWCEYDGKTGNGDDVVGSRHWKYVCNQGVVDIEPCADYRNQICVQSNTMDLEGTEITFRNSACIANNWRECINLNTEEGGIEKCKDALNCEVKTIDIDKDFKFDACTPRYPPGFSLSDERYKATAGSICALASRNCTYLKVPKGLVGGCKEINEDCLSDEFTQKMNDFCRSLGDCGLEVNTEGKYTENYAVLRDGNARKARSQKLDSDWISTLIQLSVPVQGNYAEMENYTKYLEAVGILDNAVSPDDQAEKAKDLDLIGYSGIGLGAMGAANLGFIAYQAGVASAATGATFSGQFFSYLGSSIPSFGAFSAAAIGATLGAFAGQYLAKSMGLNPLGTILMSSGGAMIGATVAYAAFTAYTAGTGLAGFGAMFGFGAVFAPCIPCLVVLAVAIIIMVIASFLSGDCAEKIQVQFECKVWQPPTGGDDCDECNDDPLRPCSEYRCKSLGAACVLRNKGTQEEMCEQDKDDGAPPMISSNPPTNGEDQVYKINPNGFTITDSNGDCLNAYEPVFLSLKTNDLAICKFDFSEETFEEMSFDFGNMYRYNHSIIFPLPDPSHGESQGSNWTGDLEVFVKCQDSYGHETPEFYKVDMCVKQGPDKRPPLIRATNPPTETLIGFNKTEQLVIILTNELSECRWDKADKEYSTMENALDCSDTFREPSSTMGYVCSTTLPTPSSENKFYMRCKDQPWLEAEGKGDERNSMTTSYIYTLSKPGNQITIESIKPDENIETSTDLTSIELEIKTSGGGEYHGCSYSLSGYENMIELFETGSDRTHKQPLTLSSGQKKIYVKCIDETGDSVIGETSFEIFRDTTIPQIARVWQIDEELNFVTTEDSDCRYSTETCRFKWENGTKTGEGISHEISAILGEKYFIRCMDEKGNVPSECSIEVIAV